MSLRPDFIFEIHQLWQSGFSKVYSNFCCSCSFEPVIIKIGWSSHKMYSNNIVNFQESTTILNACTKKVWKLIEFTTYTYRIFSKIGLVRLKKNVLKLFCILLQHPLVWSIQYWSSEGWGIKPSLSVSK